MGGANTMSIETKINPMQVYIWVYDENDGDYNTECKNYFHFEDGERLENDTSIKYCPFCGKTIIEDTEDIEEVE